ncbi:PREDICTED: zinc finger MYM-type, partial [Prunus dulcis]
DVDSSKESELQDILANLIADPGLRPQMLDYDPNIRDEVRRAYLQKGPCQPKDHTFPQTDLSGYDRRFNVKWFDEFDWLEYSLPFRGHDESDTSSNKGNYLELLQFLADHDEKVKAVVLENAPRNLKLIAPTIQKDLVNACATETIKKIIKDMDGAFFSLLVDESRDVSVKEQMAVVFRYVDKSGDVIE